LRDNYCNLNKFGVFRETEKKKKSNFELLNVHRNLKLTMQEDVCDTINLTKFKVLQKEKPPKIKLLNCST